MRRLLLAACLSAIPVAGFSQSPTGVPAVAPPAIEVFTQCPAEPAPKVIDIEHADPDVDQEHHDEMRGRLITNIGIANRIIRLGPKVILDFSGLTNRGQPLLSFGPCVTLTSVSSFEPGLDPKPTAGAQYLPPAMTPARTPQSLGPLLRFGPPRGVLTFMEIRCFENPDSPDAPTSDGVRISGFRIHGPSFGQQSTLEIGIKIVRCVNIQISNMEIAGWGGGGIVVLDATGQDQGPASNPSNGPGARISHPAQVKIFKNFIHHNQFPQQCVEWRTETLPSPPYVRQTCVSETARGYGVSVSHGAWAEISENVFDFNRHAIEAAGDSGGYDAIRNLTLKGGGVHGKFYNYYTHIFDVHGTGCWWSSNLCGDAGTRFLYHHNAFQYRNGPAIKIRGRPLSFASIRENIFPHEGLENDWGDDAIHLQTDENITIGPGNVIEFDTYGRYKVCDFDGDGIDDLFLPTGETWWYSSYGEFHWSYLNAAKERLDQVRLGYFDDDLRCDVLTESNGEWLISSGGTGPWTSIGSFGKPLSEVAFGQFDPNRRDHRPGVTRRTTHAFWRGPDDPQWYVTPLSNPDWQPVQSSSKPMSELRFGDFTGDGVTDVLAVDGGRWAISESARGPWRNLNTSLSDDVSSLLIADLNNNNIDDIIKLETKVSGSSIVFTWWVSDDGVSPWRKLKTYSASLDAVRKTPMFAFAGRFGAAPGGGVLLTDVNRKGRFYSEAEVEAGASPDWTSLFEY